MSESPISRLYLCLFLSIIQFLAFIAVASAELSAEHCHLDIPSISGENRSLEKTYPNQIYEHSPLHSPNLKSKGILEKGFKLLGINFGHPNRKPKNPLAVPVAYSSEDALKLEKVVESRDYILKVHQVNTTDNWTLTIFQLVRINGDDTRKKHNLPAVYIGHGLLSSAADWLVQKRENGLPYILADQGYDVWLGNSRGNEYTKQNAFPFSSGDYWDFSVDEMGTHDVPATIDYILEKTSSDIKTKLNYVGYSMSTTSFFICMSENSTYNAKINKMVAVGPAVFLATNNVLEKLVVLLGTLYEPFVHNKLTEGKLLSSTAQKLARFVGKSVCHATNLIATLCNTLLNILGGIPSNGVKDDFEIAKIADTFFPASTSAKTLAHFLQFIKTKKFRKFSRGLRDNPPSYNLAATSSEVIFIRGTKDAFISENGVKELQRSLTQAKNKQIINVDGFNHLSLVYSPQAAQGVYDYIVRYFESKI